MYNYSRDIGLNMDIVCNYDFNTGEYKISFDRSVVFLPCKISDSQLYKIKTLHGDRIDIGDCSILNYACHLYFNIVYDSAFHLIIYFVGYDSPPYPITNISNIIYGCHQLASDIFKNRFIINIDFYMEKIVEAFIENPDFCFDFVSSLYAYGHKYMKNRGLL